MSAVFRREFKAFFFTAYNLIGGSSSLTGVFANVFSIVLMLVLPILTMRLFSDEKRQRTDQALLTAPVASPALCWANFLPPC